MKLSLSVVAISSVLAAQSPVLELNAAIPAPGSSPLTLRLKGKALSTYAVLADVDHGPTSVLGERFYLGFTPALVAVDSGVTPAQGGVNKTLTVVSNTSMIGLSVFAQAVILDPQAANGFFASSGHQTVVFYAVTPAAHREFFDQPSTSMTGNFDASVAGRLQAGAVVTRTHSTVDPNAVLFGQPVIGPLNNFGAKVQMVYRPKDLGSVGQAEWVTAIRWRPFQGSPVINSVIDRLELNLMHSHVTPDYSIDPFSALPKFPQSGLAPVFVSNRKPGEIAAKGFDQRYPILAQNLRPDGYMPYPGLAKPFRYNGVDSLLLEFRTYPGANPVAVSTGQQMSLMVVSSRLPAGRSLVSGKAGALVHPGTAVIGVGDNAMADYQLEFTRTESVATSRWMKSIFVSPDYQTPVRTEWLPPGTSIVVEYRGALSVTGAGATPWNTNIDVADGFQALQYRVLFAADLASGEVPVLDAIVIPYR